MKVVCTICKQLILETEDEQDLVSHGMHETCGIEYYRELELHPVLSDV